MSAQVVTIKRPCHLGKGSWVRFEKTSDSCRRSFEVIRDPLALLVKGDLDSYGLESAGPVEGPLLC